VANVIRADHEAMMLAELRADFPFGVLLVTDDQSVEPIPGWSSDDQQVTSTRRRAGPEDSP
jgi:hypothetical protein